MLPKNLAYGSKIQASSARSRRTNIPPQNGSGPYALGNTIILNIPCGRNQVLVPSESYLKGSVQLTNLTGQTASFRFDKSGAHSLINRIRIFHGANEVEDMTNYNNLANMLYDIQMPTDAVEGKFNVLTGSRSSRATQGTITAADATDLNSAVALSNSLKAAVNSRLEVEQVNSGEIIGFNIANNGTTPVYNFCIPLISIIGTLCPNVYFPCFACQSAPLRVEIDLVSSVQECICVSTTGASLSSTLSVNNLEYVANFIELSDDAMGKVMGSLGGQPLQFVISQFKNSTYTGVVGSSEVQMPLPFKYTSLKSVFISQRDDGSALNKMPFSSVTRGITNYQFRVGSTILPIKQPNNVIEMYAELLKAISSISDLTSCPAITRGMYSLAATETANQAVSPQINTCSSGSFYVGLDLEQYTSAPKDSIFAGYNSNLDDMFFIANYPALGSNVRFDAYALFDSLIVCENSICYRSV